MADSSTLISFLLVIGALSSSAIEGLSSRLRLLGDLLCRLRVILLLTGGRNMTEGICLGPSMNSMLFDVSLSLSCSFC